MTSATGKACWVVAASVGVVEALKDQGICRWNYVFRSLNQHAKTNLRSYLQAKRLSSYTPSASAFVKRSNEENVKQSEESLKKAMYMNCWGPN